MQNIFPIFQNNFWIGIEIGGYRKVKDYQIAFFTDDCDPTITMAKETLFPSWSDDQILAHMRDNLYGEAAKRENERLHTWAFLL
jgi:hypothetical protein